ncbi:MAG: methionine--tRNA ligase [Acidobacteria bacterium]|nr:methionine--tRNA ligase [Acidobacteriota bacterium]
MKYYLTTPIYYVNAAPHIGHTYTTIVADLVRRFKTMQGCHAVLTTGTDEHGQKVERSAKAAGKTPEEFTAIIAEEFRRQWEKLGFKIDRFQRTTSPRHHKVVQDLFARCLKNGYIYKSAYSGQYCFFDELYVSDAKPGDPCPDCGRPTETVTEENLFFKLSAFTEKLIELHEQNPEFLQPESRRNEVLAFLRQGLTDLSISRTTIQWGIPVPDFAPHVFYVWFDALTTYMSAVEGQDLWPADLHLIGKEIVRFHAIYWPAFLMAAEMPLPKRIYAHGWLLFESDKMSKSRGNIVRAMPIAEVAGIDALRYFLLREIVFGQDGSFSYDALVGRYNSDLANGLGNLVSRTLTMIRQYRGGVVPASAGDAGLAAQAGETIAAVVAGFERFEYSKALEALWALLSAADKYIVEQAPWKLAKKPEAAAALDATLYTAAEVVRIATVLLAPVIPDSAAKIWAQLGMAEPLESARVDQLAWGQLAGGQKIGEIAAVFPRIEAGVAIPKMQELEVIETARQAALLGKAPAPSATITIDDFVKVDMRVGVVLEARTVKGADKLLHMKIDIGEPRPRSIVAGIAEAYTPEQMIGRKVAIVANLQPRKLRGIPSEGMIIAASEGDGKPVVVGFHEDVPVGARLR